MKVFIWQCVDKATGHHHREGGVAVFAETEARARALANAVPKCKIRADEMPDTVRDTTGREDVFIFPNAGCCG